MHRLSIIPLSADDLIWEQSGMCETCYFKCTADWTDFIAIVNWTVIRSIWAPSCVPIPLQLTLCLSLPRSFLLLYSSVKTNGKSVNAAVQLSYISLSKSTEHGSKLILALFDSATVLFPQGEDPLVCLFAFCFSCQSHTPAASWHMVTLQRRSNVITLWLRYLDFLCLYGVSTVCCRHELTCVKYYVIWLVWGALRA